MLTAFCRWILGFDDEKPKSEKNDHRLIMAFSVFGLIYPTELINTERVEKSYPNYWSEMDKLVERSVSCLA